MVIKRGDIFYADLRPVVGSEQGGIRPVLIIQNDIGNKHSPGNTEESQSCPVREPGTSHYIVKISFSQAFASCMAMGNHQVFTGTKAVV